MTAVKAAEVDRAVRSRSVDIAVLLFYGPDAGHVAERSGSAARAFVSDPSDPFQLVRFDGELIADQPARLVEEAATRGLFGGARAIWVRPTSRNIAAGVKLCLEADIPEALVVLEAGDLQRSSPLRSLCEASPRALALPCFGDEARELISMLDATFRAAGMRIDDGARELLLDSLGGDRLATRSELDKLTLYMAGQTDISVEDVEAVVSDVSAPALDGALDAAFCGDLTALDAKLAPLLRSGAAQSLLPMALRHLAVLRAAQASMEHDRQTPDAAMKAIRSLHFRRRDAVRMQLGRWRSRALSRAAILLQTALLQARQFPGLTSAVAERALMQIARLASGSAR